MEILIAEDEAIIAISLYTVLAELGYQPLEPATSSAEALSVLQKQKPAMAIVDIHLGEYFSGFAVAAALQKQNIPFVFLTALFDKDTIDKAKTYNPAAYLVKPFTKQNLFATIELSVLHSTQLKEAQTTGKVYITEGNKQIEIDTASVVYLEAENKYIFIHLDTEKKLVIRSSFQEIMEQLKITTMIQVHKSYVINTRFITALKYDEVLIGGKAIPVGRTYRSNLRQA
jgi:DNA-binding LytR/AlgR family response regulator